MNQELQLGKYEFIPYDDQLSRKLKLPDENKEEYAEIGLEELLERLTKTKIVKKGILIRKKQQN